jgi:hypothetical protein
MRKRRAGGAGHTPRRKTRLSLTPATFPAIRARTEGRETRLAIGTVPDRKGGAFTNGSHTKRQHRAPVGFERRCRIDSGL